MAVTSFCRFMTLQVGVGALSMVYFALAVVVASKNVFDFNPDMNSSWPWALAIVLIFVALLCVTGLVMFYSAFKQSRKLCIFTMWLVVIVMTYWICLSCLSFVNSANILCKVCLEDRCGDSLWLTVLKYRGNISKTCPRPENTTKISTEMTTETTTEMTTEVTTEMSTALSLSSTETTTEKGGGGKRRRKKRIVDFDDIEEEEDYTDTGKQSKEHSKYVFGLPMVGAILCCLIYLVFFLFSMLTLWNYAQDLKRADYYAYSSSHTSQARYL